jgi:hypothetical protein
MTPLSGCRRRPLRLSGAQYRDHDPVYPRIDIGNALSIPGIRSLVTVDARGAETLERISTTTTFDILLICSYLFLLLLIFRPYFVYFCCTRYQVTLDRYSYLVVGTVSVCTIPACSVLTTGSSIDRICLCANTLYSRPPFS